MCVCVCVYVLKTIADVCSYVDWWKILGEFKCLDQGHKRCVFERARLGCDHI